jgi:hypothetical protein
MEIDQEHTDTTNDGENSEATESLLSESNSSISFNFYEHCSVIPDSSDGKYESYECTVAGCKKNRGKGGTGWKIKQASTSFKLHLEKKHPHLFPEKLKKNVPGPMDQYLSTKKPRSTEFSMSEFNNYLANMIICCDLPFRLVERPEFRDLVTYLRPTTVVVGRTKIVDIIKEVYKSELLKLKQRLNSCRSRVSITCDAWTSKNQLPFLAVTVHYIDENWDLQKDLLDFQYIPGSHTGANLASKIYEILENRDLTTRLLAITADNASNNDVMMKELEKN